MSSSRSASDQGELRSAWSPSVVCSSYAHDRNRFSVRAGPSIRCVNQEITHQAFVCDGGVTRVWARLLWPPIRQESLRRRWAAFRSRYHRFLRINHSSWRQGQRRASMSAGTERMIARRCGIGTTDNAARSRTPRTRPSGTGLTRSREAD